MSLKLDDILYWVACPRQAKIIDLAECKKCGDHHGIGTEGVKIIVDCPNTPVSRFVVVKGGRRE